MRALVLAACLALLGAACGDGTGEQLTSSDTVAPADAGCVLQGPDKFSRTTTWRVRSGDSLRKIAGRVYGDEELWQEIRDANAAEIGDGTTIHPGMELTIPFDGR